MSWNVPGASRNKEATRWMVDRAHSISHSLLSTSKFSGIGSLDVEKTEVHGCWSLISLDLDIFQVITVWDLEWMLGNPNGQSPLDN